MVIEVVYVVRAGPYVGGEGVYIPPAYLDVEGLYAAP
jgi:hypothetical protein